MIDRAQREKTYGAIRIRVEFKERGPIPASIVLETAELHSRRHFLRFGLALTQLSSLAHRNADAQCLLLKQLIAIVLGVPVGRKAMPVAQVVKHACLPKSSLHPNGRRILRKEIISEPR